MNSRKTGWRRERLIHVGDSLHSDVGGAIIMGFKSGWVNRQHRIHDIGTHTADYELASLLDMLALIPAGPAGEPRGDFAA